MPIPILLGALAALGVGGALGAAQGMGQRRHEEESTMRKVMAEAAMSGTKLPADVIGKYFSKDAVPAFMMLAEAQQHNKQQAMQAFQGFGGGENVSSPTQLTQPPAPSEMTPGDTGAPEWALPGPTASPSTATPNVAAFIPQAVRPSAGGSMSLDMGGGLKGTKTLPGVSEAEAARVNMETQLQPGKMTEQQQTIAKGKREEEAYLTKTVKEKRQEAAASKVRDLLTQAAEVPDAKGKAKLYEQAFATALGEQLPVAKDIQDQLGRLTGKVGERLDLTKPDVAEYVKSTGTNPLTQQPATAQEMREANAFMKERTTRQQDQARIIAGANAAIQTLEAPKRLAVSGSIKTLIKEGDAVAKTKQTADQINTALSIIEKNIDAFPTVPILGPAAAMTAEYFQTERGRKIKDIAQALQTLQTLEARRIAGEVGRIPNQVEQQWRAVNPDPRRVTRATAQSLIKNSRELMKPLGKTLAETINKNAKAARGVGVPDNIVESFTKGDLDVLKSAFGSGLESGALPPSLSLEDLK